jgi:hypothetical protein
MQTVLKPEALDKLEQLKRSISSENAVNFASQFAFSQSNTPENVEIYATQQNNIIPLGDWKLRLNKLKKSVSTTSSQETQIIDATPVYPSLVQDSIAKNVAMLENPDFIDNNTVSFNQKADKNINGSNSTSIKHIILPFISNLFSTTKEKKETAEASASHFNLLSIFAFIQNKLFPKPVNLQELEKSLNLTRKKTIEN